MDDGLGEGFAVGVRLFLLGDFPEEVQVKICDIAAVFFYGINEVEGGLAYLAFVDHGKWVGESGFS